MVDEYAFLNMEHFFELPVMYKGEELSFNGRLVTFGYVYKFHIMVNGHELVLEKDDDENYRVLAADGINKLIDVALIEAIIKTLESLTDVKS